jgi:hypothetical protein
MKIKKLATLFATMAVGLGTAWAQGTIDFHTINTLPVTVDNGPSTTVYKLGEPGGPLGAGSVRIGLFVGPLSATDISQMQMVGMVTNSSASAVQAQGTFNGGTTYAIPASFGYGTGTAVKYLFAGWSISTGALTYQAALTATQGYAGQSAIGGVGGLQNGYVLGGGGNIPGQTFGAGPAQLQGFTLHPLAVVPEPSTIALGLLGAGALLLRRRKAS